MQSLIWLAVFGAMKSGESKSDSIVFLSGNDAKHWAKLSPIVVDLNWLSDEQVFLAHLLFSLNGCFSGNDSQSPLIYEGRR